MIISEELEKLAKLLSFYVYFRCCIVKYCYTKVFC